MTQAWLCAPGLLPASAQAFSISCAEEARLALMMHVVETMARLKNEGSELHPGKTDTTMGRFSNIAYTLLRVGVGTIMIVHGAMKLSNPAMTAGSFEQVGVAAPNLAVYLAILGELGGGIGLLLGLLTRLAAVGPALVLSFAIVYAHAGNGLLASNGGWEYPLTLILASLLFVAQGGGPYSLDAIIRRMRTTASRRERSEVVRPSMRGGVSGESLHRSL